jgi:hypothetical protein
MLSGILILVKIDIFDDGGVMDWIHLVLDRGQWRAFVDTVINLGGSLKMLGNSLTS